MADGNTKHEKFQNDSLTMYKEFLRLTEDATLTQVIEAMADLDMRLEATEMLFGADRKQAAQDQIGWALFLHLLTGDGMELLKKIVGNHKWSKNSSHQGKGYAIRVYRDEYLVITEPLATEVLQILS